jgi:hypothetical protein
MIVVCYACRVTILAALVLEVCIYRHSPSIAFLLNPHRRLPRFIYIPIFFLIIYIFPFYLYTSIQLFNEPSCPEIYIYPIKEFIWSFVSVQCKTSLGMM